jgi:hypothetical protein
MLRLLVIAAGIAIAAAALLDENPPQLKGTYTLGAAFRLY